MRKSFMHQQGGHTGVGHVAGKGYREMAGEQNRSRGQARQREGERE